MIRVLHGNDEYAKSEALDKIRASAGAEEVREPNTTVFDGILFGLDEVVGAASVVPFMAERRVVIVHGILSRMEDKKKSLGDEWKHLSDEVKKLPATTELVFVESISLRKNGIAFKSVGPSASIQEFRQKQRGELELWIRDRFASYGASATKDAISRMGWLAGSDTRLMDQEIKKLALYVGDRKVDQDDVNLMVTEARETKIFAIVDAVLEGRVGVALKSMYAFLSSGSSIDDIIRMLARQVRLLILAIELRHQGVSQSEIGKRIGVAHPFALAKTIRQSSQFSTEQLADIHRHILAADLAIKQGEIDKRLAIEILVTEISSA